MDEMIDNMAEVVHSYAMDCIAKNHAPSKETIKTILKKCRG